MQCASCFKSGRCRCKASRWRCWQGSWLGCSFTDPWPPWYQAEGETVRRWNLVKRPIHIGEQVRTTLRIQNVMHFGVVIANNIFQTILPIPIVILNDKHRIWNHWVVSTKGRARRWAGLHSRRRSTCWGCNWMGGFGCVYLCPPVRASPPPWTLRLSRVSPRVSVGVGESSRRK